MNNLELVGFKSTVLDLLKSDKRQIAFDLLDHFFKKATTMEEFDAIGELALKTDYRTLYLKCAEISHSVALTTDQKRASRANLINAYNAMNYPEKALFYIQLQLQQTPDDFNTLCQKAANISLTGDKKTSEKMICDLLQKYPEKRVELQSMLSGKYLREGKLVEGVQAFVEAYKPRHKIFDEQLQIKRWDGIPRPGRIVYVDGEGGIGDEIINIRFFEKIKSFGMRPILCSPDTKYYKDKNSLFKRHGIEILSETFSIKTKEFWVPMMSLPAVLNLTEKDLWNSPYLFPLRKKEIRSDKFKIGIKCSGNPYFAQDEYRKIPLELMVSYLPKEAELYYIDKIKVNHPRVINTADEINNWDDTLDLIDSMDCIVSSCTSLVHAAGAIGKTTFVAVPIAEYYIWTSSKKDYSSPWYGENFYVMRQKQLRQWNEPLAEIEKYVKKIMMEKKFD